ncbi:NTP transferase domain-containing protein [Aquirhabdus sp.]|uniref:nucleotidyltransferase family protein n=1 Tax=Aquirhabdus sp. TaxID=2824160 RepID=UPI00396CC731
MLPDNAHAVVILAAGNSNRLGRPKQLLTIQRIPLVRYIALMALMTKPARVVVIVGTWSEEIRHCLSGLTVDIVLNDNAHMGMASSLHAGAIALSKAHHSGPVLILGVDQPRLAVDHLETLLSIYRQYPDRSVVSQYADTIGMPAIISMALFAETRLLTGDVGLKKILLQNPESLIAINAPQLGFDIDTPNDLVLAIKAGWIDP